MSVAWLVSSCSTPCALCNAAGFTALEVEGQDIESLARLLTGREIVVTRDVALGEALLRRCRWIRGIIGVGARASEIVDWAYAEHTGILVAVLDGAAGDDTVVEQLLATLARMDRRLRALDDIAEHWEGT